MKSSVYQKLEGLVERFEEVQALLSDPATIADQEKFRTLSQEFKRLDEVTAVFNNYKSAEDDFSTAELMLKDDDPDMREMAQEEFKEAKKAVAVLADELQVLLLPRDPMMIITVLLKFARVLVAMKPLFLLVTCSECTVAMLRRKAGKLKS